MLGSRTWNAARIEAQRIERSSENWKYFYDSALCGLVEYEMRGTDVARVVTLASAIADASLAEFEQRWADGPSEPARMRR